MSDMSPFASSPRSVCADPPSEPHDGALSITDERCQRVNHSQLQRFGDPRSNTKVAVGGFDESYWNGNEDVDLCLKLGQAGWSVRYEPASVLVHQESVSGTERFRETTRNRSVLTARWSGKVLDEREHQGVVVAAPFGRGDAADAEGRRLVGVANSAGVPVVTRAWPRRFDGTWAHRLGPGQPLVVSPLTGDDLDAGLMADREWLPDDLVVIAGPEAITKAGLDGPGAPQALLEATGRTRPGTRSAWRAQRAG